MMNIEGRVFIYALVISLNKEISEIETGIVDASYRKKNMILE